MRRGLFPRLYTAWLPDVYPIVLFSSPVNPGNEAQRPPSFLTVFKPRRREEASAQGVLEDRAQANLRVPQPVLR